MNADSVWFVIRQFRDPMTQINTDPKCLVLRQFGSRVAEGLPSITSNLQHTTYTIDGWIVIHAYTTDRWIDTYAYTYYIHG